MTLNPKVLWPLVTLALTAAIAAYLMASKPSLEPHHVEPTLTTVRVLAVEPEAVQLSVHTQGSVAPRTESHLVSEVSGRIVSMSPALVSGGQFDKDEVLLRIDDRDYVTAIERNRAALVRAEVEYEHSSSEYQRLQKIEKQKLASQSQLEEAQRRFRLSEADQVEARINLQQAQLDLSRTVMKAPYSGRVRHENVDLGQFVSRGENMATIYATDYVEIRVPIANQQFAYLDLPSNSRGQLKSKDAPAATVFGEYANISFVWTGAMVRLEAEIDAKNRMFYGVVRIKNEIPASSATRSTTRDTVVDPGSVGNNTTSDSATDAPQAYVPQLMVGLFVNVDIEGRIVNNVVTLPRSAMRDNSQVLVVDKNDRLHFRDVKLLRIQHDQILLTDGLNKGERVCISPLQVVVDGMRVNPVDVSPSASKAAANDSSKNKAANTTNQLTTQ